MTNVTSHLKLDFSIHLTKVTRYLNTLIMFLQMQLDFLIHLSQYFFPKTISKSIANFQKNQRLRMSLIYVMHM